MSVNLRYPNISGFTEKEQLAQIKSYLYQIVDQLNYALPTLGTGDGASTVSVQGSEINYYELRTLVIQQLQEVQRLFDELEADILTAKANGEFDGKDGYTPEKGKDYFTAEEIDGVAYQAAGKISFILDDDGNLYYELEE